MNRRKSVWMIVLVAVLLSSAVSMASASTQTWCWTDTGSGVSGADYVMIKGDDARGVNPVAFTPGTSKIWVANEAVTAGPLDMSGTWTGFIRCYVVGDSGTSYDVDLKVEIGKFNPTSTTFTLADYDTCSETRNGGQSVNWCTSPSLDLTPDPFSIANGEYLAIRFTNEGTSETTVNVVTIPTTKIRINSPSTDPGYPVPELSTIVLTSTGLLALGGFVLYRRRRNNK